ncbi:TonB-dependent receptor domain-containing protein [Sphingorhabdus contaminans]|uniref:TonB-dependent receptor domain-containing protein n=1 Tax=Sphingorhabdus contaminans TaxID=1343899 RepID=UPI003D2CA1CC
MNKTIIALLTTTLVAAPALAEDSVEKDTIVVIATRTPSVLADTPAPVSLVTADDLQDRQSQSSFDALKFIPGINVGGGPRQQGEMPAIRGFDRRQIILTVDGARRNTTETLRSPLYVDPSFVARIESLKGASSALYGAGGLGGVLAFETISAKSQLAEGEAVGARAFGQYQSGAHAQRYGAQVYGKNGALDALFAVAYRKSGDIRQGNGLDLDPADTTTKTWLGKIGLDFAPNWRAELSQKYFTLDDFGPNNPQADNSFVAKQPHNVTAHESVLSVTGGNASGSLTARGTLYRTSQRWVTDAYLTLTGSDILTRTTGGSLQLTGKTELGSIGNTLTVGLDAYEERNRNFSNGAADAVNPLGRQTVKGVFAQDEISFAPWLSITPAIRWDQFKTNPDAAGVTSQTREKVTFKGTLALRPVEGLLAWASYGEAYRAPTVSELYQNLRRNNALFNFAPNAALKPESADEIDVGLGYSKAGLLGSDDRFSARVTWFDSRVSDLITSRGIGTFTRTFPFSGTGTIFQYQNVSKAKRTGIEAEASYASGPFDLNIAYSRVRSTDRNTGENLFSPPDRIVAGAGWQATDFAKISWAAQFVSAQDYDSTLARRRAAYDVHDLFVTLSPESLPFRIDAGVTNIFDKTYALYKNSTANPNTFEEGRSIRITLSARY